MCFFDKRFNIVYVSLGVLVTATSSFWLEKPVAFSGAHEYEAELRAPGEIRCSSEAAELPGLF